MRHLESSLQIHCVRWFRYEHPDLVIFSIPNGGKRSAITAKIMKAEGQMPGVADLFVMCSKNNYACIILNDLSFNCSIKPIL